MSTFKFTVGLNQVLLSSDFAVKNGDLAISRKSLGKFFKKRARPPWRSMRRARRPDEHVTVFTIGEARFRRDLQSHLVLHGKR